MRRTRRSGAPTNGRSGARWTDRKSTRLNSSHSQISYAVFCLKKKKNTHVPPCRSQMLHRLLEGTRDVKWSPRLADPHDIPLGGVPACRASLCVQLRCSEDRLV